MIGSATSPPAAKPVAADRAAAEERAKLRTDKWWMPRMWHGMRLSAWLRLLAKNGYAVDLSRVPTAVMITLFAAYNSLMNVIQQALYGRRIENVEISEQPIFVIGHYRSGTTLLHELLALDARHAYPTTYQCAAPNHFLLSEAFTTRWFGWLLPKERLPDNMPLSWDRPQEDELALLNLGQPSPYAAYAFGNRPAIDQEYYEIDRLPAAAQVAWKGTLLHFLKAVTLRNGKRLVLKSPAHTCRIATLLEMFPDARFVYIVRDPYVVFPSTMRLFRLMQQSQGLQTPRFEHLEELVLETFSRMHEAVERARNLVAENRFCTVRYEELARNPLGQMRAVYEQLELGDFDAALPALEKHLADVADYQTNRYAISDELREKIAAQWRPFIERHGYGG